ncbi:hypothetical protein [Sphingomonas sp.]|uniref:hypothetical protein n=1 Tax=Sphingomonas sp. TaxID=28214 RepID=UPI003B3B28AC
MPHSAFALRNCIATLAIASGMALATAPATAATNSKAVDALSRLSAADLDTRTGPGQAFLKTFFIDPAKTCGYATPRLPFDKLCQWYADPQSDAVFPDLMVGLAKGRMVSVVTAEPKRLKPGTWTCEKADPGRIAVCFARTIDPATQRRWSKAWHSFLDSAN